MHGTTTAVVIIFLQQTKQQDMEQLASACSFFSFFNSGWSVRLSGYGCYSFLYRKTPDQQHKPHRCALFQPLHVIRTAVFIERFPSTFTSGR